LNVKKKKIKRCVTALIHVQKKVCAASVCITIGNVVNYLLAIFLIMLKELMIEA
jgi:hypothetical protein